jgi:hypothetical protein
MPIDKKDVDKLVHRLRRIAQQLPLEFDTDKYIVELNALAAEYKAKLPQPKKVEPSPSLDRMEPPSTSSKKKSATRE